MEPTREQSYRRRIAELEAQLGELVRQNHILIQQNAKLTEQNTRLTEANATLTQQVAKLDSLVETPFSAKSPPLAIAPGPLFLAVWGSYERIKIGPILFIAPPSSRIGPRVSRRKGHTRFVIGLVRYSHGSERPMQRNTPLRRPERSGGCWRAIQSPLRRSCGETHLEKEVAALQGKTAGRSVERGLRTSSCCGKTHRPGSITLTSF